jgi:hypothetical protein
MRRTSHVPLVLNLGVSLILVFKRGVTARMVYSSRSQLYEKRFMVFSKDEAFMQETQDKLKSCYSNP